MIHCIYFALMKNDTIVSVIVCFTNENMTFITMILICFKLLNNNDQRNYLLLKWHIRKVVGTTEADNEVTDNNSIDDDLDISVALVKQVVSSETFKQNDCVSSIKL